MNAKPDQIACPRCRAIVSLLVNGNTIDVPLVCSSCGQTFSPHFYCPDENESKRHVFAASKLYVDNVGVRYTFCPTHTFTTYALTPDNKPRRKHNPLYPFLHFFDTLIFRLALMVEGWRLALRR